MIGRLATNARGLWIEIAGNKAGASKAGASKLGVTKTKRKVAIIEDQLDRKTVALRPNKIVNGGVMAELEKG